MVYLSCSCHLNISFKCLCTRLCVHALQVLCILRTCYINIIGPFKPWAAVKSFSLNEYYLKIPKMKVEMGPQLIAFEYQMLFKQPCGSLYHSHTAIGNGITAVSLKKVQCMQSLALRRIEIQRTGFHEGCFYLLQVIFCLIKLSYFVYYIPVQACGIDFLVSTVKSLGI